jgi:N-acetylmuramoyl-L-alanine amidase
MKKILILLSALILTGCVTSPPALQIDRSLTAKGQSSRVRFLVLHYTVSDLPSSIKILTEKEVSSHYLLTDEAQPKVYQLVDETRSAYHAGISYWKGYTQLNNSSVGIEIVNPGFTDNADGSRTWYPFPPAQVDTLVKLVKDIVERHKIAPENVVGHTDIAPQRKQDPGKLFPWHVLAQHGLVVWPDRELVDAVMPVYLSNVPDAAWFQKKLAAFGYATPQTGEWDKASQNVLTSFQMRYRQSNIDGQMDAESAALLQALSK